MKVHFHYIQPKVGIICFLKHDSTIFINLTFLWTLIIIGPSSFDSPDIAPLRVLCEMLHTMEGVFWKLIRGQGLAYGTSLSVDIENGKFFSPLIKLDNYKKVFV